MCAVRSSAIVLPKEPEKPVIMAGMGTGLAPWRAVTQERCPTAPTRHARSESCKRDRVSKWASACYFLEPATSRCLS